MQDSIIFELKPDWEELENVRKDIMKFLKGLEFKQDFIYSVVMIISELMENSVKYGCFQQSGNVVTVSITIGQNNILLEVFNPVSDDSKKHLERLDRSIQWIRGFQDPFEAYIEKLKEVSKKPLNDQESGLGLVRIAYEGKAVLDFIVSENGQLNVSAISDLNKN